MTDYPKASLIDQDGLLSVPDCWEALTPKTYLALVAALVAFSTGKMSPLEVKAEYVRCAMTDSGHAPRTPDDLCNIVALAAKVTFPFRINYDNEKLLDCLDPDDRELMHRVDPNRLDTPIARAIARKGAYHYTLNNCFCAQLLPTIDVDGQQYQGYTISTDYGMLSTNMTALQYLDARSLMANPDTLPLLAAVLYCPGKCYDPETAHRTAHNMEHLDPVTLSAIQLCFQAFDNYLLTRTHFSILQDSGNSAPRKTPLISTGPVEALYSLASSGYGSLEQVEQMNVVKYLTLMRKQLIDSIHAMKDSGMKITEIATKSGLSFTTINKILQ